MDYEEKPKAKKSKFGFGKKNKKDKKAKSSYQPRYIAEDEKEAEEESFAAGFRDVTGELSGYAEAAGYDEDDFEDDVQENEEGYFPPSFSEYLASIFASIFYRVRGMARGGSAATMEDEDEDLGVTFENGLMDEYRSCRNKCMFCFIDQMPPGMRETLYFKNGIQQMLFRSNQKEIMAKKSSTL